MQTRTSVPLEQSQSRQTPHSAQLKEDSAMQMPDTRTVHAAQLRTQDLANSSHSSSQLKMIQAKMQSKAEVAQRVEEEEPMQAKFLPVQRAEEEEPLQGKFETAQRAEEEEPLQGKFETAQRAEEEEPLQGKFETAQRAEEEEPLQGKFGTAQREEKAKPNNTGLPNQLKAGIESMSGMSMDHVKVHYNSDKPAQLNAHAYAQGSDIHVAPGQEQHLPHEAWHVVQQAQGRVKPTMQMKMGVPVNDDVGLESEADVMGAKAMSIGVAQQRVIENSPTTLNKTQVQLKSGWKGEGVNYHRVANKDVVRVVPAGGLGAPKNYVDIAGSAESKGGVYYPDVEDSTAATADISIVLKHDSDPGAKITTYAKDGYTNAPPKSAFAQEPHYHKGTLKAKRVKEIHANTGAARDFSDKPVNYTDNVHDYVDANAGAPTTFDRL